MDEVTKHYLEDVERITSHFISVLEKQGISSSDLHTVINSLKCIVALQTIHSLTKVGERFIIHPSLKETYVRLLQMSLLTSRFLCSPATAKYMICKRFDSSTIVFSIAHVLEYLQSYKSLRQYTDNRRLIQEPMKRSVLLG